MIIDCDRCEVRDIACGDCVVTLLLGATGEEGVAPATAGGFELDEEHQGALDVLASSGLVPPLRLVVATPTLPPGRPPAAAAG